MSGVAEVVALIAAVIWALVALCLFVVGVIEYATSTRDEDLRLGARLAARSWLWPVDLARMGREAIAFHRHDLDRGDP